VLLTLFFLGLSFYRVDLAELTTALQRANYALVIPAALLTLFGYVLRTVRWRAILTRAHSPGFRSLFAILMIGFATNNLLPARLGELARAYLLSRGTGHRKTLTLATILLERVFDGLVLITLLGVVSVLPAVTLPGWGQDVQRLSSLIFLAAGAGVLLLLTQERLAERVLRLLVRPLPQGLSSWAEAAFTAFVTGLAGLRRGRILIATLGLSVMIWMVEAMSYFTLINAFDLSLGAMGRVAASLLVLVIVNLGIMLPSAPGYVGTYQFFAMSALAVFGVPRESGLALGIVSHVMQYVLVTAIGVFYLSRLHLSLGRLAEEPREEETTVDGHVADAVGAGRGGRH
jgi:uncharacterized protein (TIRG00374 family)